MLLSGLGIFIILTFRESRMYRILINGIGFGMWSWVLYIGVDFYSLIKIINIILKFKIW